ncbi:MAG: hypothetical protein D3925_16285 [Candidatus Electrothrix sp. AR5]|nr:hypothetical protein [Candidatus Electrothrix sp. AR5]
MLRKYYLLGSIALFFLSGCASLHHGKTSGEEAKQKEVTDREIAQYVLAIDPDGKLNFIGCDGKGEEKPEWCEDSRGKNEEEVYKKNLKKYLDNIIAKLKKSDKKLLIYIHGGLNGEKGALERVKKKYKLILNDKKNPRYPIFVNWRSGPATTYLAHLWKIRQGEKSGTAWATFPVYLATDISQSIVNAPKAWLVSGEHMLNSTIFKEYKSLTYCNKEKNVHCRKSNTNYWDVLGKLKWTITSPSKVITTPFTYTLAKPAWDIMLRRTNTLFYTPSDLELKANDVTYAKRFGATGSGALYQFLAKLEEMMQNNPDKSKVGVDLIGHSMGAIIINKIINHGFDLPYKNIVHMASADSIENLFNQVVPYLAKDKSKDVKFYSLALHPKNEDREPSAWGLTPSGSLLTWIDNKYTIPETVMSKRSGRWDNMASVLDLLPTTPTHVKSNMHFTVFGIKEKKECSPQELKGLGLEQSPSTSLKKLYCTAQEHGDFGDLPFWLPEVWKGTHLPAQGAITDR